MKRILTLLLIAAVLVSGVPTASAEARALSAEAADWWNGIWYGWRVVTSAGGSYAEQKDLRTDVVGTIQTMDASGVIVLWDYDTFAECAFLTALGSFHYDESGLGRFYSESGFAFSCTLEEKSLNARVAWDLDHMLRIQGLCTDPDDSKNWFRYDIYLRPWGMEWDDIRDIQNEDIPYTDMLPAHYEDWYLSLLSRGLDPLCEEIWDLG